MAQQASSNPYADLYQQKLQEGTPPPADTPAPQQSTLSKIGSVASDLGVGALKGAGSTANNLGHLIVPDWALNASNKHLGTNFPVPTAEQQEGYFKPANTTQAVGKAIEQGGEFLIPGGAEERGAAKLASLAPKLGRFAEPLAKIGTSAVSSGLVNKAQGGEFGTGAAAGAAGAGLGQGIKALAPKVAETALRIGKSARGGGRDIGSAVLNETTGIRPESVSESAKGKISSLYAERQGLLDQASVKPNPVKGLLKSPDEEIPLPSSGVLRRAAPVGSGPIPSTLPNPSASLSPARNVLSEAMGKARGMEAPTLHSQVGSMSDFLHRGAVTGEEIPENITPSHLSRLQQGFSDEHLRWNPDVHEMANAAGQRAYGAMTGELGRTAPETVPLNTRISNLIPAQRAAESTSRNATTGQRVLGRFGAHSGALLGGTVGAGAGYREAGIPGAIAGGATGILAPELIASPEGQMAAARLMNKAGSLRPAVGVALQANRKDKDK